MYFLARETSNHMGGLGLSTVNDSADFVRAIDTRSAVDAHPLLSGFFRFFP
jgi:hypothetical protein